MTKASETSSLRAGGISSILSAVVVAVAIFIIFRISVQTLSAAVVGCWALIQAVFVFVRLPDSGAGSNVTRYIADRLVVGESVPILQVWLVSCVLSAVPVAALCILLYVPVDAYVSEKFGTLIDPANIRVLCVCAAVSATLNSLGTVSLAACEGAGRLTAKNWTVISSNFAGMIIVFPATQAFGAGGLGYTYVGMSIFHLMTASILVLRVAIRTPSSSQAPPQLWRQMASENFHMSIVALLRLSFEPMTKLLLSASGSLETIAAFELALRVSTQARVVLQAALQPFVAMASRSTTAASGVVTTRLRRANDDMFGYAVFLGVLQIVSAPVLSVLGFGHLVVPFVIFLALLAIGNWLNAIGLVGYLFQVTSGRLRPLVVTQAAMAVLNACVGSVGVAIGSPFLVVAGYAASFGMGGLMCLKMLQPVYDVGFPKLLLATFRPVGTFALLGVALAVVSGANVLQSSGLMGILAAAALTALVAGYLIVHVARRGGQFYG